MQHEPLGQAGGHGLQIKSAMTSIQAQFN